MKLGGRAKLRGKTLDKDCYKAEPLRENNDRIYCSGLYSPEYDMAYAPECEACGAFYLNATSLLSEDL